MIVGVINYLPRTRSTLQIKILTFVFIGEVSSKLLVVSIRTYNALTTPSFAQCCASLEFLSLSFKNYHSKRTILSYLVLVLNLFI